MATPASKSLKVALFDATGTLMMPSEPIGETYRQIAEKHGLGSFSASEIESRFREVYGRTAAVDYGGMAGAPHLVVARETAWWRQIVSEVLAPEDASSKSFASCFEELFNLFGTGHAWRLYPEAKSVLEDLADAGWTVGICSNFDHRLPNILHQLGVMQVAKFVVLPGDCGCLKPARGIFTTALQRAGWSEQHVGPITCFHVGDSVSADVIGAVESGILPVLVDRRGKFNNTALPPPAPPSCFVIKDLRQIVEASRSMPLMQRAATDRDAPTLIVSPDDVS